MILICALDGTFQRKNNYLNFSGYKYLVEETKETLRGLFCFLGTILKTGLSQAFHVLPGTFHIFFR